MYGFEERTNYIPTDKNKESESRQDVYKRQTQTIGIKAFNDALVTDDRVEKVILPLRDGDVYKRQV